MGRTMGHLGLFRAVFPTPNPISVYLKQLSPNTASLDMKGHVA